MPPKFDLQPVLDFRHQRVSALEVELSQLMQAWQHAQVILASYERLRVSILDDLRAKQAGVLDLGQLDLLRRNVKLAERAITQQQAVVAQKHDLVQAKQQELIEARQAEEALEKLREQARERWQAAEDQKEQRQRDDIYIARSYQRHAQEHTHDGLD